MSVAGLCVVVSVKSMGQSYRIPVRFTIPDPDSMLRRWTYGPLTKRTMLLVKEVLDQSGYISFQFFAIHADYRRDSGGAIFFC
jgi:hypothetical protein